MCIRCFMVKICYMNTHSSLMISNSMLLHSLPWHFPHAEMHFTLFFLHEHRLVLQSPEQLQLTNFRRFGGASAAVVGIGSYRPNFSYQPNCRGARDMLCKLSQYCSCR